MTEFVASNGVGVELEEMTYRIDFNGPRATAPIWLGEGELVALREFFQHERDEEMGVWRSQKDRTWTALRRNRCVYFQNEDHGRAFHFVLGLENVSLRTRSMDLQVLAHEYIEAHA